MGYPSSVVHGLQFSRARPSFDSLSSTVTARGPSTAPSTSLRVVLAVPTTPLRLHVSPRHPCSLRDLQFHPASPLHPPHVIPHVTPTPPRHPTAPGHSTGGSVGGVDLPTRHPQKSSGYDLFGLRLSVPHPSLLSDPTPTPTSETLRLNRPPLVLPRRRDRHPTRGGVTQSDFRGGRVVFRGSSPLGSLDGPTPDLYHTGVSALVSLTGVARPETSTLLRVFPSHSGNGTPQTRTSCRSLPRLGTWGSGVPVDTRPSLRSTGPGGRFHVPRPWGGVGVRPSPFGERTCVPALGGVDVRPGPLGSGRVARPSEGNRRVPRRVPRPSGAVTHVCGSSCRVRRVP